MSIDSSLYKMHTTNLKALFDLFHEHVAIGSEAIDSKDSLVSSTGNMLAGGLTDSGQKRICCYLQTEDLGSITGLDVETLCLTGVASNNREV